MALPDNYDMWEAYDRQCAAWEYKLPICELCGERIQQDRALYIMDLWICDDCINDNMRWIEE